MQILCKGMGQWSYLGKSCFWLAESGVISRLVVDMASVQVVANGGGQVVSGLASLQVGGAQSLWS